jgi:hypothetical protein
VVSGYNPLVRRVGLFVAAMLASLLPKRLWPGLPSSLSMTAAAFASGLATLFAGAAIGVRGFLAHAHQTASLAIDSQLTKVFTDPGAGYSQGMSQGFAGLAIFTFLLLTPLGWLTLYLVAGGGYRMGAAWFDDPFGDPILTAADAVLWRLAARRRLRIAREDREAREGPAVADRVVSSEAAGLPGCDFVVVSSRRKPGWERGVAVFTAEGCYRLGEPVEQTIAGRLRTLYPLTAHGDLEAIRRRVDYDLPAAVKRSQESGRSGA